MKEANDDRWKKTRDEVKDGLMRQQEEQNRHLKVEASLENQILEVYGE